MKADYFVELDSEPAVYEVVKTLAEVQALIVKAKIQGDELDGYVWKRLNGYQPDHNGYICIAKWGEAGKRALRYAHTKYAPITDWEAAVAAEQEGR